MNQDTLFERAVLQLLANNVICQQSEPEIFAWLEHDPRYVDELNTYLGKLNRSVMRTSEQDGYYCVFVDQRSDQVKRQIEKQFQEIASDIAPLVQWLALMMSVTGSDRPLRPGELLQEGHILQTLEAAPEYAARLCALTDNGLFKSSSADLKRRLSTLLSKLVDQGYLVRWGNLGSQYKATAKWSWLYDVLDFIASHEGWDLSETIPAHESDQLGLPL